MFCSSIRQLGEIDSLKKGTTARLYTHIRPRARYGLPPPTVSYVDHDFL